MTDETAYDAARRRIAVKLYPIINGEMARKLDEPDGGRPAWETALPLTDELLVELGLGEATLRALVEGRFVAVPHAAVWGDSRDWPSPAAPETDANDR